MTSQCQLLLLTVLQISLQRHSAPAPVLQPYIRHPLLPVLMYLLRSTRRNLLLHPRLLTDNLLRSDASVLIHRVLCIPLTLHQKILPYPILIFSYSFFLIPPFWCSYNFSESRYTCKIKTAAIYLHTAYDLHDEYFLLSWHRSAVRLSASHPIA